MKAITLYQPWASLVASGAKKIETRSWSTDYRGKLAIHVAKNKHIDSLMCWHEPFLSALKGDIVSLEEKKNLFGVGSLRYGIIEENLHLGCVIATCDLVCVKRIDQYDFAAHQVGWTIKGNFFEASSNERAFGDYSIGRFMWFLANIKKLNEPIPARGNRRLWEWEGAA